MEALVAVGFAANILNFVDFICHALKIGNQIRRNGMSDSNADLEKSITLLEHQMNKIRMQCGQTTSDADVDECLGKLAAECITIAQEIKGFIEKFELDKTKPASLKKVPEKLQPSPNQLKYEQLKLRKEKADHWTSYLKTAPVPLTADQENEKSKLEARRAQLKRIKERDKECGRRKTEILEPFTDKHEGELYAVEKRYDELLLQKSNHDAWKRRLSTKVAPLPFTDDHETELKDLRTVVDHEKSKFESQRIAIQEANKVIKKGKSERLKIKTLAKAVELEWNKPKIKELVEKLERIRSLLYSEVMLGMQRSVRDLQTRSESTDRLLEQIAASGSEHRASASAERKHGQSAIETFMKSQQSHLLQFDNDAKQRHETVIQAIDSFKTCLESRVLFPTLPVLLTRRDPSLQSAAFYGYEAIENAVLGTLHYRRMEAREAQVHDAHEKTCRWIFEDPKDADRPWTNFRQWLEQGKGCYWIEGKAGCGKSTLMKFLRSDVRTQRALEKWSESKRCIVASCFFWMAGTSLQKNQEGLLRSLLHTILGQRRELISRVLPGLYNALMPQIFQDNSNPDIFFSCDSPGCSHSFRQPSQLEEHQNTEHAEGATVDVGESSGALTVAELRKAFNLLASQHLNDFQICLLVDGLDEYAGNQQDVAELFKTVTKHPFIKAVVSSRPEATFVEAFSKTPKLRMEDLTAPDFELYIKNTLLCHSQMQAQARTTGLAERLTSKILTRACGVFLWVALVVRSLIQCLSDGSYPEELETAIEAYPPELHELYEHMFARMKPSHRLDAFKLFQAVSIAQEVESEIPTALRLSYFERDKSIGAIRMPIQGISPAQLEERLSTMQARLRSRCCGLLEIHSDTSSYTGSQIPRSAEGRVVFLHRTVSDFLQDPGVRDLLDRETLSIRREIYESLLASFLYRCKSRDFYRVKNLAQWKQLTKDIEAFMIYCERSGPRNQEYLEEYKKVLTELYNKVLTEPRATNGQRTMAASWMELVLQERGLKVSLESDDNPLLSLLVRFGLLSPARKIISSMDSSKTLFFETGGRLIVLRLCFWAMQHGDLSSAHIEIMQCFIDSGFDVNARAVKQAGGMQRTAWESLLRLAPHVLPTQTSDLVAHCYARSSVVEPGSEVSHGNMASRLHSWIGLVALFIRSGADLGLELEPCSSVPKGGTAREVIREILTTAIDGAAVSSAELVKLEEEKARVEGLLDERPNITGACRANILPSNAPLLRVSSTQAKERRMSRARKVEDCTKLSQHETRNGPDSQTMVPAFATTDPQTRQYAVEALEEAGFTGSQIDSAIERAGVGYDVVGLVAWILDNQNQAHQAAKPPRNLSPFGNNATRAQIHGADAKSRQWAVVAKELSKPQQPKVVVGAHYFLKPKKPKNRRPKKSTIDSVKYDDPTENAHASRSQPGTAAGSFCLPSGTFTWFFETNNGHRSDVNFSSEQLSQLQKLVESMIQE